MDQGDVLQFQNIDHLNQILKCLNRIPQQDQGTDFSRVREYALQGWSKFYRQTILISEHNDPELKSIFHKSCQNFAGRVHFSRKSYEGTINQVLVPAKQVFKRLEVPSIVALSDTRFTYFQETFLPQLKAADGGTLIFIPSYFDFVRLRNWLKVEMPDKFVSCCEYTRPQVRRWACGAGSINLSLIPRFFFQFFTETRRTSPVPGATSSTSGNR